MVTAAHVRGPLHFLLQSSGGQWIFLGLGAFTFFPDKVQEILRFAMDRILVGASSSGSFNNPRLNSSQNAPIIIHTGNEKGDRTTIVNIMLYLLSAAGIFVSYNALSNLLPDSIKEYLPVTRKLFEKSITNLGKGIINLKDVLGRQIMQLDAKQEQTLAEISIVQENIEHVRNDLNDLSDAMGRCETSLENSEKLQSYTARGVKLLVKTVATLIPGDHRSVAELSKYSKEGEYLELPKVDRQEPLSTPRQSLNRSQSINPQERTPLTSDPEKDHPITASYKMDPSSLESISDVKELLSLIQEGHIQPLIPRVART